MPDLNDGQIPDKPPYAPTIQNSAANLAPNEALAGVVNPVANEKRVVGSQNNSDFENESEHDEHSQKGASAGTPWPRENKRKSWLWLTVLGLLLVTSGILLGTLLRNPPDSSSGIGGPVAFPGSVPTATVTITSSATASPSHTKVTAQDLKEVAFLSLMRSRGFTDDAYSLNSAKLLCSRLDGGATVLSLATEVALKSNPAENTRIGTLFGAGVPAFCPQYQAQVDEFMDAVKGL